MTRTALLLALSLAAPAHAKGGHDCRDFCHPEKPPISCLDVVSCLPPLPTPRPCLDLDLWYFPGNHKCEVVDAAYLKPAYLCVSEPTDTAERKVRKVRRNRLINVLDAIVEAEALNRTLCGN